jgi:hypothetical protein
MPQNYASYPAQFFALFTTLFINDVASQCGKKMKRARVNFFTVFMLLGALTARYQAVAHAVFNSVLKMLASFINHYLAYASSHGIGGGGGGGHGGSPIGNVRDHDIFQVYFLPNTITTLSFHLI